MQFRLWWAAAFISSPIYLFIQATGCQMLFVACTDPVRLVSIWRCLPQRNTIAPDIGTGVELEEKDALRCIPLDGPLASCFGLQYHHLSSINSKISQHWQRLLQTWEILGTKFEQSKLQQLEHTESARPKSWKLPFYRQADYRLLVWPWNVLQQSHREENTYNFLLVFNSNFGRTSYRFCGTVDFMPQWPCRATITSKWQWRSIRITSKIKSPRGWAKTYVWQKCHVNPYITFSIRLHIMTDKLTGSHNLFLGSSNKQCAVWLLGSADTVCPRLPLTLTFDHLTSKQVCESHLRREPSFQIWAC